MTRRDTAPPSRRWRSGASWRVSGFAAAVVLTAGSAGCGGGTSTPDAVIPDPLWWRPAYGTVKNWDIQLNAPFDLSTPRAMYILDLWALVPLQMTLDYGDGAAPIPVPPGNLAGRITELHARTPAAVVICRIETGIVEMDRPDTAKFPDTALGGATPVEMSPLAGHPRGRFLDVRAASRAAWAPILFKRFDLARQIGCDGILPAHNDVGAYLPTGFTIPTEEIFSWYAEVAKQGHDRMLSTGMQGGETLPDIYGQEVDNFDWVIIERCGEISGCDFPRPFFNAEKPVLALEYQTSLPDPDGDPPTGPMDQTATVCAKQGPLISEGLLKDDDLSSKLWTQCEPDAPSAATRR